MHPMPHSDWSFLFLSPLSFNPWIFTRCPGRILLDYVDCIGNETNIGQCHHRGAHGISHCPDGNITSVSCSYPLRLAHEWRENYHEGRNRIEFVGGLPESKHKGEWGTMCVKDAKCTAEYLDVAENAVDSKRCRDVAQVVCKGLGYSSGDPDAPEDERRNKARDHRIVLTVECNGRQGENFADCQKEEWKQGDCDWNEVLFVYCHNEWIQNENNEWIQNNSEWKYGFQCLLK